MGRTSARTMPIVPTPQEAMYASARRGFEEVDVVVQVSEIHLSNESVICL